MYNKNRFEKDAIGTFRIKADYDLWYLKREMHFLNIN